MKDNAWEKTTRVKRTQSKIFDNLESIRRINGKYTGDSIIDEGTR